MLTPCQSEARRILERAFRQLRELPPVRDVPVADAADVVARLALHDIAAARDLVPADAAGGTVSATVAAAARHAEQAWRLGLLGFDEAVAVFAGLEQMLRRPDRRRGPAATDVTRHMVLFVPAAEQHSLGARVAAMHLGRPGLDVRVETGATPAAMQDTVATAPVDAVGLSIGTDAALAGLAETIARLRRAARNPHLPVVLGGAALTLPPAAYGFAGADLVTNDCAAAAAFLAGHRAGRERVN